MYANASQRVAHLVQLERLDNSHHDFHLFFPVFLANLEGVRV
jgi:hypothetical protein